MKILISRSSLPDLIDIDGIERPSKNNQGRYIVVSLHALTRFWRWFGESKAIDDQGRPIVFYHGTGHDIQAFRESKHGNLGAGIYLTDSIKEAETYTYSPEHYPNHIPGGNIIAVYVRTLKPYLWTEEDSYALDSVHHQVKVARSQGCDSVIYTKRRSQHLVAFTSNQLKSAVGNNGNFDPDYMSIDK